jgi:hypothetical protein
VTWTFNNCRVLNSPIGNNTIRERHLQCYAWMVTPTPLLTAPTPRQPFSYFRQPSGNFRFSILAALAALISPPGT